MMLSSILRMQLKWFKDQQMRHWQAYRLASITRLDRSLSVASAVKTAHTFYTTAGCGLREGVSGARSLRGFLPVRQVRHNSHGSRGEDGHDEKAPPFHLAQFSSPPADRVWFGHAYRCSLLSLDTLHSLDQNRSQGRYDGCQHEQDGVAVEHGDDQGSQSRTHDLWEGVG